MPVLAMSAGRVTAIQGHAYVRLPDGSLKALQVGDKVPGGTRVITDEGGIVEISPLKGSAVLLSDGDTVPKTLVNKASVDKAISGIEARDALLVPASGLAGDAEGGLRPALRVDRVSEVSGAAGPAQAFSAMLDLNLDEGPVGSGADQRRLGPTSLPMSASAVDGPHVNAVEVLAADNSHVYFGVRLSSSSDLPTQLRLTLSPGHAGVATTDVWTGDLEYSLDAAGGLSEENIAFLSWRPLGTDGEFDAGSVSVAQPQDGGSAALLILPPDTPAGLILVKVPVFVQTEAGQPHFEGIRLQASTQYDTAAKSDEALLMHGEIEVTAGAPVAEGDPVVFNVTMSGALDRSLRVRLTLGDGEDDSETRENERGVVGSDTATQLSYRVGDGVWLPVGDDGVVVIPMGTTHIEARVQSVDDAIPEDQEYVQLSISGVPGEPLLPLARSGQAAILASDEDFDPVSGTALDMRDVLQDDDLVHLPAGMAMPGKGVSSMNMGAFDADVAVFDAKAAVMISNHAKLMIEHV